MNVQSVSVTSPPTGQQQKCKFSVKTQLGDLTDWSNRKGFSIAPVSGLH